ncbi:MAG: hypothetical protein QG602_3077 [Verrucomicrobiota bacterium]|nr:hypothetical protein [Verrucomicrobiota bacterium]
MNFRFLILDFQLPEGGLASLRAGFAERMSGSQGRAPSAKGGIRP